MYGLANAPHNFYIVVRDKMVFIGFRPHSLDVCMYMYFSLIPATTEDQLSSGLPLVMNGQTLQLEAAVLFHVDDMVATFSPTFKHELVKDAFSWGADWKWAPDALVWNGFEMRFDENVMELATHINLQTEQIGIQANFIECLERQIADQEQMMQKKNKDYSEAIAQWRGWKSKEKEDKDKLWNKIGLLEEAVENAQKHIGHLMMDKNQLKNEKSTSGPSSFSCMSWCR